MKKFKRFVLLIPLLFLLASCDSGSEINNDTKEPEESIKEDEKASYFLALTKSIDTAGEVSGSGVYKENASITVTATINNGYKFMGWYKDNTLVSKDTNYTFNMPKENIILEAKYEIITYNLEALIDSNSLNLGTVSGTNGYNLGDEAEFKAIPNNGYSFKGWYNENDELVSNLATYKFNVSGDLKLYAKFEINKYKLSLKSNLSNVTLVGNGDYDYLCSVTVKAIKLDGYNFLGWYKDNSLVDSNLIYSFNMPYNDLELEAKYEIITYNLEALIDSNSLNLGTVSGTNGYNLGDEAEFKAIPNNGYSFKGWYNENDELVSNLATYKFNVSGDLKLYAKFEIINYSITYVLYDGSNDIANLNTYNRESNVTFNDASKFLMDFDYWYILENNQEIKIESTEGYYKDLTVYAKYKEIEDLKPYNLEVSSNNVTILSVKDEYIDSEELVVPSVVTNINQNAFSECSKLVSLTLPFVGKNRYTATDSYKYPFGYIFSSQSKEGYTEVKQQYQTTGSSTYEGTYYIPSSLKNITINDTEYIQYGAFHNCTMLENVILENVVTLASRAFWKCGNIKSFDLPNTLETMEYLCLNECKKLESLVIPDSVIAIGKQAVNNTGISSIVIGKNVETIGEMAFYYSPNLVEVVVPNSVTSIGLGAFGYCGKLEKITLPFVGDKIHKIDDNDQYPFGYIFGKTENSASIALTQYYNGTYSTNNQLDKSETYYIPGYLKEVIITNDSIIQAGAFYNCIKLESIKFTSALSSIGVKAFYRCISLEEIDLGNTVSSIGLYAFDSCENLKSLIIPNSVTLIGEGAFSNTDRLESLTIPFVGDRIYNSSSLNQYPLAYMFNGNSSGSVLLKQSYIINPSTNDLGSITIPFSAYLKKIIIDGTNYMQAYALNNLTSIDEIVIGESVTRIEKGVLAGNQNLISLTIPFIGGNKSHEMYFSYIFGGTSYSDNTNLVPETLNQVELLNSAIIIPNGAFINCNNIVDIIIPSSINNMSFDVFDYCTNLENVYYDGNISDWFNINFSESAMYYIDNFYLLDSNGDIEFNNKNYKLLEELIIPDDIEVLNNQIRYYKKLISIDLGNGIKKIESKAFNGLNNLRELTISSSLKEIAEKVFVDLDSFDSIYYNGTISDWLSIDMIDKTSNPLNIASNFYLLDSDGDIIHNGLNYSIPKNVFISSEITSIPIGAFERFTSLENVYYEGNGTDWTKIQFANKYSNPMIYAKHLYIKDGSGDALYNGIYYKLLEELIVSEEIEIIDYQLFNLVDLKSLTIPYSVTSIKKGALFGLSNLESITIPYIGLSSGSNDTFGSLFGNDYFDNTYEVYEKNSIRYHKYFIPNKLKEVVITNENIVNDSSFYNCKSIEAIILPDTITDIYDYAFYNCSNLRQIRLGNNIRRIENYAFYGCLRLFEIFNGTNFNILAGNYKNGFVAYYAAVIHNSYDAESILFVDNDYVYATINDRKYLVSYIGNEEEIVIDNDVNYIYNYAFYNNENIRKIVLPNNLAYIGDYAFYNCTNLEEINIPNSVSYIGSYAFYNCKKITSISLNENIDKILKATFSGCENLVTINIPSSINDIEPEAFDGCIAIEGTNYQNGIYLGNDLNPYYVLLRAEDINIENITIHENCKIICYQAFKDCINLKELCIPDNVEIIGKWILYGCYNLEKLTIPFIGHDELNNDVLGYVLGSYIAPNGTVIYAHTGTLQCTYPRSLSEIEITKASMIAEGAFKECKYLKNIILPDSLISIGKYAFEFCSRLSTITLPKNLSNINSFAFYHCDNLKIVINLSKLNIAEKSSANGYVAYYAIIVSKTSDNIAIEQVDDYLFAKINNKVYLISYYGTDDELILPINFMLNGELIDSYIISKYAFRNNKIYSVVIPEGVTEICDYAFLNTNIRVAYLSESLKILGTNALDYTLKELYLPSNIEKIGKYAIPYNVSNLNYTEKDGGIYIGTKDNPYLYLYKPTNDDIELIKIDSSCIAIFDEAFKNCKNLSVIYNLSNINLKLGSKDNGYVAYYASYIFNTDESNIKYYTDGNYKLYISGNNLPHIVEYSGNSANVNIPDYFSINSKLYYAYYIDKEAFKNHTEIINLSFTSSVVGIGKDAFLGCDNLENVYYSSDEYYYNNSIVEWCSIKFLNEKSNPMYYASNFYIKSSGDIYYNDDYYSLLTELDVSKINEINDYSFVGFDCLTKVMQDYNLSRIGDYAFYNCINLAEFDFISNIEYIGDYAFYNCNKLTTIELPYLLDYIGDYAFYNTENANSEIVITELVSYIGEHAFYKSGISGELVILCDLDRLSDFAFSNCYNLTKIELIGNIDTIGEGAFVSCKNVTEVIFSGQINILGKHAFDNCTNLENINLGDSLDVIDDYAFAKCTKIERFIIPDTVSTIGNQAFSGCFKLKYVSFGEGVTRIGSKLFEYLERYGIDTVVFNSKAFTINYDFEYTSGLKDIYFNGTISDWLNVTFDYTGIGNTYYHYSFNLYYLNDNGDVSFEGKKYSRFYDIIIPDTVGEINNLYGLNLGTIVMSKSINSIGKYSFKRLTFKTLYYLGTIDDFKNINFEDNHDKGILINVAYNYSEEEPINEGRYWHYVDGIPTKW